jgi:hypothetical protein
LEWAWVYIIRTFRPIYCELSKAFSLEIFPVYKNVTIEVLYTWSQCCWWSYCDWSQVRGVEEDWPGEGRYRNLNEDYNKL